MYSSHLPSSDKRIITHLLLQALFCYRSQRNRSWYRSQKNSPDTHVIVLVIVILSVTMLPIGYTNNDSAPCRLNQTWDSALQSNLSMWVSFPKLVNPSKKQDVLERCISMSRLKFAQKNKRKKSRDYNLYIV